MVIRQKILLLTSILLIFTSTISGIVITKKFKDKLTDRLLTTFNKEEILIAEETARILEIRIKNLKERLELLAQIPDIKNASSEICNNKLLAIFDIMSSKVDNLTRINSQQTIYCSVNKTLIGLRAEMLGTSIKDIFTDPQHKAVLSHIYRAPGSDKYAIRMHIPLYEGETFLGTLGGTIYIEELDDKYLQGMLFATKGYVVLQDDNGDILYYPQTQFIGKNFWSKEMQSQIKSSELNTAINNGQLGKEGIVKYVYQGVEKQAAYTPVNIFEGHRWVVLVTIPVQDIKNILDEVGFNTTFFNIAIIFGGVIFLIPILLVINYLQPNPKKKLLNELLAEEKK